MSARHRAVSRRNRRRRALPAAVPGHDWVLPYWLRRQRDHDSAAYVPDPGSPPTGWTPENTTARNWTLIGALGSPQRPAVDPRGLLTPTLGEWSLDWWIGAEDRWHVPSREGGVRQTLVDDTPVVETRMRVPGGDIVHRSLVVQATADDGGEPFVVVEVSNETPVPVVLALAVRPYGADGIARIERIRLDGTAVYVDDRVALQLSRPPAVAVASTFVDGDSAATVLAGDAVGVFDEVVDPDGGAQAAVVVPLTHRTTFRAVVPLGVADGANAPTGEGDPPGMPGSVPDAGLVVGGWTRHDERGMRVVVPEERLHHAVVANRHHLRLLVDVEGSDDDRARLAATLAGQGLGSEAIEVLESIFDRPAPDGAFAAGAAVDDRVAATGAVLWSLGRCWDLGAEIAVVEGLVPVIAGSAQWTADRLRRRRRGRGGVRLSSACWGVAGIRAAERVLTGVGEISAGSTAAHLATAAWAEVTARIAAAPPTTSADEATGALSGAWPLDLFPSETVEAMCRAVDVHEVSGAVAAPGAQAGWSPLDTIRAAGAEIGIGSRSAQQRLDWLLQAAGPTWSWPTIIHPTLAGGTAGAGHDHRVAIEFLDLVRSVLLREHEAGVALLPLVPDQWLGQGIEVHDAPTRFGRISFALRWHGERPALLWEVDPGGRNVPFVLDCPGLDPGWSTRESRGDALLAAPTWKT